MLELFTRLVRDFGSRDAEARADLRLLSQIPGVISVRDLTPRQLSRIAGVVSAVTQSCSGDSPRLHITVADGTGEVHAQFLGRREISGIRPGALIVLEGRFCSHDGVLKGHNPVYELIQTREDHE
ncbi:MAG: OB-fold nucleic acid binding domain-containing protein [Brevibacterium sp.]|uniref:OB-fold nucleic acid binding domain-containing protein n=1 Tax=Brevibacterium sandarakinum TaxID=629680 RepID=UPI00264F8292|nr:OB-fold nucleic acid binding domain-containing protein [Brevibacterium sandarakinum]MDN5588133.1 OB-fold nucleic acid binding domain-containing protein [Brevibacterium sp.]MDN5634616.1 OB-fold nucleic acid binding domain-containing protein [Brevibacterium sp.]MDN5656071.1 OB-fold nucleic acid binding domain-containing protein [Brevibacterium sandarakinum]